MKSHVILLNGPAAVGKSTVASRLSAFWTNCACVAGGALKRFVVRRDPASVEGRLTYRNGASVVANFLRAGYDAVIFEFVSATPDHIEYFLSMLRASLEAEPEDRIILEARGETRTVAVHAFLLWASPSVVRERERGRLGREPLGKKLMRSYTAMEPRRSRLGYLIETESRLPEDIAEEIHAICLTDAARRS